MKYYNNNIFFSNQLAYGNSYLIKWIINMYLE